MRPHFTTLLLLLFSLAILSCSQTPSASKPLTIGISKERKTEKKYSDWLLHQGIPFDFIDLSLSGDALASLDSCDALLLTGGNDIYPAYYGKEFDTLRCGVFDHSRDSLELLLFHTAIDKKMPVLGICRGLQLINVALGGSLFIDLPEDYGSGELHRQGEEGWTNHTVGIQKNSLLDHIIADSMPFVASNHHQGIERLSDSLKIIAWSLPDSLPEAISWRKPEGKGFLLAVQWHPEWMDSSDTLSSTIAGIFLEVASKQIQGKH
jgi:putative glutamine amidotransferase